MLNDPWKKYIIKIKCEKNITTEQPNNPSVIYLCRICSGFRTDSESLVEAHLVDRHQIQSKMYSELCSCDDSNDANQIALESVLTTDNSTFTTSDTKGDHISDILNTLYCQTSYASKSPTNVDEASPVTNDLNSLDSISPPQSPVSPVLRELNSTRKKITITLNSSPPLPTTAPNVSELQNPQKAVGTSGGDDESTSSLVYRAFLSSSNSPKNPINSSLKHKCPDCNRCFSSYKAFERHTLRPHAPAHQSDEKLVDLDDHPSEKCSSTTVAYEFMCSQCDRSFATSQAYKIHARAHKSNKKSTGSNDPVNSYKNDLLDSNNNNHRKETIIESRYRTILPKPCNKQSSMQFSLLDLKPKRRNARRQTNSLFSSQQNSSLARKVNKNDDGNNPSIGLCKYSSNYTSNGNLHIHPNPANIVLHSANNNPDNQNNGMNINNQIIYDSMVNTSDTVNKPPHLLTVAAAYASQISFSTYNSSDTSQNLSNDSSIPGVQVYPIPWSSDAHNSSLVSTNSLISNVVVNSSIENPVSCSDNQLDTTKTVTTNCELSFSHESITPYSFIQLYPVMSSDGILYYMTGTPVELTQTNNNNSNEINLNHTIMSTNCESNYNYTTDEICSSNDNRNENENNDHIQMNSSISQNFSETDIDSALLANDTTSCTYIVNNNNNDSTSKSNEGTVYFSSHYDGITANCQPVPDYLSNDVEVIDLNIPVTVVHLDQNRISSDSQLSTTVYDMDSVPNQDFPVSYSNSEATDQEKLSEQLSLSVSCDKDQNNLDNSNNDNNEQLICETTTKIEVSDSHLSELVNTQVSKESHLSLPPTIFNASNASQLNNNNNSDKIDYESIDCIKEYLNFNKTITESLNNNTISTLKNFIE
uniref:C2H2-type domain-containing protein n=1 Tax=Schistosoma mansoni TaxID=6183 RepID=A0A5K4FCQ0_SCHMA